MSKRSLGIILYEMITKKRPFTMSQIFTKQTPQLSDEFKEFDGILQR
jgi:hypothetical protein